MNAFLIWYRSRPSDELTARLRTTLRIIGAEIVGENTTINAAQVPNMLAASLRAGDATVIIGGMDLLREEDNIVFILSRCLSLKLEKGAASRSTFTFDPVRGQVLPSFASAVLFPSEAGGPEGIVLVSGSQTIILIPWLDTAHMDMLDMMYEFLPEIVSVRPLNNLKPEKKPVSNQPELPHYIKKHAISRMDAAPVDTELSAGELRTLFAEARGAGGIVETNVRQPDPPAAPEYARFTPRTLPEPQKSAPVRSSPLHTTGTSRFQPLYRALSVLLIVTIIATSCYIGYFYYESAIPGERVLYQSELAALYSDIGDSEGLPENALPQFKQLYMQNRSVSGYISIPDTDISLPVMSCSSEDPEIYSGLDFYGDKDDRGSLYFSIDNKISPDEHNYNLVIYGKSPSDGSMFAGLQDYTSKKFLASHPIINMDTLYEKARWIVFSVCIVSGDTIGEFNYANTEFIGKYSHQIHLYNLYIRSLFYTSTEVFADEDILTLVTDCDEFEGAKLLVCARREREGEDLSYVGENVVKNDLVLMPEIWYTTHPKAVHPIVPGLELPVEPDELDDQIVTSYTDVTTHPTTTTTAATTTTTAATTTAATTTTATTEATTTTAPTDNAGGEAEPTAPPEDVLQDTQPPQTTTTTATNPTTMAAKSDVASMRITSGGKVVSGSAADVLAMIIEAEMGSGYNLEALKAQAVASYTYYLYSGGSAKSPSFPTKKAGARAKQAAAAVAGQYMSFGGNVPYTPYYAISAGHTANNSDINGANLSYLSAVDCSVDEKVSGYRKVIEASPAEIAKKVKSKKGIDLTKIADKSQWFHVESRDSNDLYVKKVRVGNTTYKGNTLHLSILGYSYLRSPCFWIEYDASRDVFVFTSLGYGTGVGMSQKGANEYAAQGYNYVWILQHFYSGVTIKS